MQKKVFTFQEIKQKLADYCVYQDRCQNEVWQKMKEFDLIDEAKDEIFIFLIEHNFLNEERFTESFVRGKFNQKNWGKRKIAFHLKQKNIPEKMIFNALNTIDEMEYENTFQKMAQEKWNSLNEKNSIIKKKKLYSYLTQKGFESELITSFFKD